MTFASSRRAWIAAVAFGLAWGTTTPSVAAPAAATESGTISGVVTLAATRGRVPEAIVIAQCTCLQEPRETQTNGEGLYAFRDLPPGTYTIQVLAGENDKSRVVAVEGGQRMRVDFRLEAADELRREVRVKTRPIAPSPAVGRTMRLDEYGNVPIGTNTNRDFTHVVEGSPTASRDAAGISLAGATGAESKYTVDGANINNPSFGTIGASIVQEFIETIEVQESGYEAEFGGVSGGLVRARLRSGTNTFRGIARFTYTPRLARPRYIIATDNAVRAVEAPDHLYQAVLTASGPILRDRLFWSAGITLNGAQSSLLQSFHARVNKDGIGGFEACPYQNGANDCADGGNYIANEKFAEQRFRTGGLDLGYFGRLDWLVTTRHRLSVSLLGGAGFVRRTYRRATPLTAYAGGVESSAFGSVLNFDPRGGSLQSAHGIVRKNSFGWDRAGITTATLAYNGRVLDDKLEIDANVAYSQFVSQTAWKLDDPTLYRVPMTLEYDREGTDLFGLLDREGATSVVSGVEQACNDRGLPGMACPVRQWASGGIGEYNKDVSRRVEGGLALTHFFTAAGAHQLKYGTQIEHSERRLVSRLSGDNAGDFYDNCPPGAVGGGEWCYDPAQDAYLVDFGRRVDNHRLIFVDSDDPNRRDTIGYGRVRKEQGQRRAIATPLGNGIRAPRYDETLATQVYAVYLQDRWAVRSNLFLSAGVRWEVQEMRDLFGDRALLLWDNVAPRAGVVYDWTDEGKSRLYASYGRFYQTLPLQLSSRVFGGNVSVSRAFRTSDCLDRQSNGFSRFDEGQPTEWCSDFSNRTSGLLEGAVAPGLKGQYTDRFQVGYEQEVIEDLVLGVHWLHSTQGRVVEDVSTNGGGSYILANPGESVDADLIAAERARCDALRTEQAVVDRGSPEAASLGRELVRCEFLVDAYGKIGTIFDRPIRNFDAFTFEVKKRFAKNWLLVANYTYSRLIGNYEGFVDPVTGAINLGASVQYDTPEVVRNSYGPLSYDTPHRIKIDGFYSFNLGAAGRLTLGTSFRFASGYPISLRVSTSRLSSQFPGAFPVYLLPRGAGGRVQPNYTWNLSASYAYPLRRDVELEVAVRLLNVTNAKATLRVDEVYSFQNARPIAGGELSDLAYAKVQNTANPNAFFDRTIVARQGNYGVEQQFQLPLAASFEVHLRF